MKLNKNLLWIIPSIILAILFIILAFQSPTKSICGDGVCQESEVKEGTSLCDIDCSEQCIVSTGAIEDAEEQCSIGWEGTYIALTEQGKINKDYLKETEEIDFSVQEIQRLAQILKRETPKETAKAIAKWTYQNIKYNADNDYYDCLDWKASEILDRRYGVCSTMSKLNIALLRANGIPAYSTTGCFKFNTACKLKQTFLGVPFPKFIDIKVDETGYAPTMGYLHNWVFLPLIEDGEIETVILESTSGVLYEDTCINYRIYYNDPTESKTCGLSQLDSNLEDCKQW